MSFNTTQSASNFLPTEQSGVRSFALSIVHHPDPRFIGARRTLEDGARIVLARGSTLFVYGALADPRMSRKHARIGRDGQTLLLEDLSSRNGTYLNGQRVERATLEVGDVIGCGNLLFLVHVAPAVYREPRHPALVGVSYSLRSVLDQVSLVAARNTSVLILGETGVGKELVAREVHAQSGRSGGFVAVNCGSVADGVLQSELFGHVRGAFSGAHRQRQGLVEEARGGTLFLDEIGDASPSLQVSLLRLLQDNEVRPVGGNRTYQADVRFVAATHRDLDAESFRQDLWARLSRWVVKIEPLRERLEDVPHLMAHFARKHSEHPVRFTARLVQAMLRYDWPGNVRELDAVIERISVEAGDADVLDAPLWVTDQLKPRDKPPVPASVASGSAGAPAAAAGTSPTGAAPRRRTRRRLTREELESELRLRRGNVKAVAEDLGIGRNTVYRWMRDMDIDLASLRAEGAGDDE